MTHRTKTMLVLGAALAALVVTAATPQGRDRKPPTAPKNLRVTGVGSWSVSLAWNASTDNSPFNYVVQCSNGRTMTVPSSQTSATFTDFSDHWPTFTFFVYAVDGSGNRSKNSNQVSADLLPDVTPPTVPDVAATGVFPTSVDLQYGSTDDGPLVWYEVYRDGVLMQGLTRDTTTRVSFLAPQTNYSFTVRARDHAGHWSGQSAPLIVTTPPADPKDEVAPSAPPGFSGGLVDPTEAWFTWGHSSDNVTPSDRIVYRFFLNGVWDGGTTADWRTWVTYLTPGIVNRLELFAVDEAGNISPPSVIEIDMR